MAAGVAGLCSFAGAAAGLEHLAPPWQGERPAIVINVPQRMLFLLTGDEPVGYPVAVGRRDWPTPRGEFTIVLLEERPAWDVPVSIQEEMRREGKTVITRMPPGPKNPLGTHWIGLSAPAVGIHGTPYPNTLSKFTTHGCIRMHADAIPVVYAAVRVGDRVQIVYEPVLVTVTAAGVFLEAHPDQYRRARAAPLDVVRQAVGAAPMPLAIDWDTVAEVLRAREGVARRIGGPS
jgi:L,D-transpeptidase ErfK/SrfK